MKNLWQQSPHPLAVWLRAHDVTPGWLAGKVGVSKTHIYLMIRGRKKPSAGLADRISRVTNIDARRLLGIRIPRNPPE